MRTSDQPFQAIFDHAAVGIAQIDLDGNFLRVNGRYCQMLGYSEAELLTKTLRDINPPDNCAEVLTGCRQLQEGLISSHSVEKRYVRKDGTVFWGRLHRSLVRNDENVPPYFVAVVEDITEKVQVEQALREREQQLALAQSAAGLGLWSRDLTTNFTITSGHYGRLRGLHPEKGRITHEEWLSMIHPDDRDRVETALQECIERTHTWDEEFRVVWPDGSVHWLLVKGQVFLDNAGRPSQMAGVSLDITDRKRAEEHRLSLASIVESCEDAIFSKNLDGTIMSWNSGAEKLFGYTAEEIIGKPISVLLPPERLHAFPQILERTRSGAHLEHHEVTLMRRDGGRVEISMTISPINTAGAVVGSSTIARDITERKSMESALRESEARFRKIADTAPVMIWVSGPDKLCTFFNAAWLTFTGRTVEQECGNGWAEGVHPADLNRCVAHYCSSFDARQSYQMEYRLRRADGQYRWILGNGVPRFEPSGAFAGYIGSCIDTTELRRAREEDLARQKLESVGILAGGVAHDFNNLLGAILAESELAASQLATGESPTDGIQRISKVAGRCAEIVRQLMIYAGQDNVDPAEPLNLSRLVSEMLELLKVSISKQAVLRTDLHQNLPAVVGRASQIRQLVMNLIINASEAVEETGGEIKVRTSRLVLTEESGPENPMHLPAGDYVVLEVSDTGAGMSEEVQAKVFDPFFTTKFVGRGLGLAVVQRIVRDHGGAIDLVSAPGKGSTFRMVLPCIEATAPSSLAAIAHAEREHRPSSGTVLIVDDEDVLRLATSRMMQRNGFHVIEASEGSSALELVRVHKDEIDVMLLDITLPGVSSREVFEIVRQLRPNLKVILTSAYSRAAIDASFAGLPIAGFIRKPFKMADLVGLLREALAG